MHAPFALFSASFHLYSLFLENPPPPGCSDELWGGLLGRSAGLHGLAAHPAATRGEAWLRLHELVRCTQRCLALLVEADLRAPLVQRAWCYLRVVVTQLDSDLRAISAPASN